MCVNYASCGSVTSRLIINCPIGRAGGCTVNGTKIVAAGALMLKPYHTIFDVLNIFFHAGMVPLMAIVSERIMLQYSIEEEERTHKCTIYMHTYNKN